MVNLYADKIGITALTTTEKSRISGGSGGWDYDIAEQLGRGLGYGIRKMLRMFEFMSKNLYEMQKNTQVIYK
ncbi:hypothetical protein MASR2M69_20610 [Bacteroidota bacterium]|mgnify:CR=1 FL=1